MQFEPSEIYLYITAKSATFIEIHHPDYGKTEYWLPETLCDYCGYEMVVQYVPLKPELDFATIVVGDRYRDPRTPVHQRGRVRGG